MKYLSVAALAMSLASLPEGQTEAKTLRVATAMQTEHPAGKSLEAFKSEIGDQGNLEVETYLNGSIARSHLELLEIVRNGTLDAALIPLTALSQQDIRFGALNVPFVFEGPKAATDAYHELLENDPISGIKLFGEMAVSVNGLMFPDSTPGNEVFFEELSIATSTESTLGYYVESEGGHVVWLNGSDIYSAAQSGDPSLLFGMNSIDAIEIPIIPGVTHTGSGNVLVTAHTANLYALAWNESAWSDLSIEEQNIILNSWTLVSQERSLTLENIGFQMGDNMPLLNGFFEKKKCGTGCPKNGLCSLADLELVARQCCPKNGLC